MTSQQKIRLIDCFFQPSEVFDIYDYTKIIYPIDGYICIRQICTPETGPNFIKLQHQYEKIHSILAFPNLVITLEENHTKQFSLGFYDSFHFHTKLNSALAAQFKKEFLSQKNQNSLSKKLQVSVKKSKQHIYILFSIKNQSPSNPLKDLLKMSIKESVSLSNNQQPSDNQLIIVNIKSKRVISRCYFPGNVNQLMVKQNDEFTILQDDSILSEYYLSESQKINDTSQTHIVSKKRDIEMIHNNPRIRDRIEAHLWVKDQLICVNSSSQQINIYVENKKAQTISLESIKNFKLLEGLMCGFIVCNQNFMFVYKKVELDYICTAEFFIRQVGFSPQLILSPQEDIIAYFMDSKKSIQYITNFTQEIDLQSQMQKKLAKQLKPSGSIEFKRTKGLRIDVNKRNNTFAVSHRSTLQLYTINNFQLYLQESIESEESRSNSPTKGRSKKSNTLDSIQGFLQDMSKQQSILRVAIHPFSQIIAVAIKSKVRIYQVLYNEISHIKDLFVSNCSEMFFSNSGQFLSIVVSGKNGSKCYVYITNQDYQNLDCLSIGKKIQKFIWNKYDSYLYGVHNSGYYRWSIDSSLKNRYETLFDIPFEITDAVHNDRKDVVVLYGRNEVLEINEKMEKENELNVKDIVKVSKRIKQIIYQNGSYFINLIDKIQDSTCEKILKCEDLSNLQYSIHECFGQTSQIGNHSKSLATYFQTNAQNHQYTMIPCSGDSKKNFILLVEDETKNIKVLEWGKNTETKFNKNGDLIKIDRKNLKKLFKKYTKYEEEIKALQQNLHQSLQKMREDLQLRQKQKQQSFLRQIKSAEQRYEQIKVEKQKLQHSIEQKIEKHEEQTIKEVKQLQKMYERKIAVTTNKLLTSEEINYRNMLLAQQNLKKLQRQTNNDVQKIREEYKKQLSHYMSEKDVLGDEILRMKKQYESRLYDLEQQNERILQQYQSKSQESIQALKRNLVSKEIKLSESLSKKDNLEKSLQQELYNLEILKQKIVFLQAKNRQANKKSQYLLIDIQKYEKILEQKNASITIYEQRINDLEKSNQILKYRVIQLKGQTEPQSQENQKLKDNLNQLEAEYDKIVKSAFQKEQMLSIVKKQSEKSKQTVAKLELKVKKLEKSYLELLDKVMNITKAPIQELRKQLINLLNTTKQDEKYLNRPLSSYASNESPLGQLNRIRQHLQVCLHEAIDSGKKGEQQKKVQLMKKNRENSQLIKEINDLRRKIRQFQGIVKDKDIQIGRLIRGDPLGLNDVKSHINQKENTKRHLTEGNMDENQTELISLNNFEVNERFQSRAQTRKQTQTRQTKESFFERSLFKSGSHWREKRLKTEHSQQRHAQTRSMKRNTSGKYLQIENRAGYEDIEDLKRVIQQKQTIIKQLINKIQTLS